MAGRGRRNATTELDKATLIISIIAGIGRMPDFQSCVWTD